MGLRFIVLAVIISQVQNGVSATNAAVEATSSCTIEWYEHDKTDKEKAVTTVQRVLSSDDSVMKMEADYE